MPLRLEDRCGHDPGLAGHPWLCPGDRGGSEREAQAGVTGWPLRRSRHHGHAVRQRHTGGVRGPAWDRQPDGPALRARRTPGPLTCEMMSERVRVAVVTGAGSGLGRACALRLGADGFAVVVNDVSAESAEQTAAMLAAAGAPARGGARGG